LQGRAADTSTGSNLLPVLVDDGEPPAHRGRRGTATPRPTASATGYAAPSDSGLGKPSRSLTAAGPGKQRQSMKWTRELNLSLVRAYYISTKVEEDCEGYRKRLHVERRKNIQTEQWMTACV
jgi:hypothetical protein